ncbi:MAG: pirin family protein [Candidatus Obscuribacterales bacterium]|nr:pirin family protein [Candidatus Obscuribacterales bacterium]
MNKTVKKIITSIQTREGAGFSIRRPFPTGDLNLIDPFLLLDHMEPVELAPGQAKGAPDHPHRGFETVTYLLEGEMEHRDSAGNHGILRPGDVQWMTAGGGVVHSEMPGKNLLHKGGRLHGFQVWVNLQAKDKMLPPRYQDTPTAKIPVWQSADGQITVKIIAGKCMDKEAIIQTRTPITYLHILLAPGATITQPITEGHNSFAYVINGTGTFGSDERKASDDQLVIFSDEGQNATIKASDHESLDLLLLAGQPLNEPVARWGPFVMNTREEIMQAVTDYQEGRMGAITTGGK